MRNLVSWILSLSLVLSSQARAKDLSSLDAPGTAADTQRYFARVDQVMRQSAKQMKFLQMDPQKMRELFAKGRQKALAYPKEAVPHMAQTMMMLWVLGGVEAVRQNAKMSPLQDQSQKASSVEMVVRVGDHMINSFDLFAGMAGASTSSLLLAKPIQTLNELISSKVTQPILKSLLTSGASSFVTFVGWEVGAKLWEQSILLLEAKDIETAKSLRFTEIMRGGGSVEERRVFKEMVSNAFSILTWADPEVSNAWIYNTWRHRVLTGEFVTMLSSMVAAGVVAGSLAPGAGTLVGFCFGLAGGLAGGFAAILLPHSAKQPVTDGFRRHRIDTGYNQLARYQTATARVLWDDSYPQAYQARINQEYLKNRRLIRENILTALFEQIYDASLRRQEAEAVLELIAARGESSSVADLNESLESIGQKKLRGRLSDLRVEYQAQLQDANERLHFYLSEAQEVQRREAMSLGVIAYSEQTPFEFRQLYIDEIDQQSSIHISLKFIYAGLLPERASEMKLEISKDDEEKLKLSAQINLNLFYLTAFTEKTLAN